MAGVREPAAHRRCTDCRARPHFAQIVNLEGMVVTGRAGWALALIVYGVVVTLLLRCLDSNRAKLAGRSVS
jgi:hypothetical protein